MIRIMLVHPEDLPDNVEALKAVVLDEQARHEQTRQRCERLERIIKELQRKLFGRRSEKLDADQLNLSFEDAEILLAEVQAELEAIKPKSDQNASGDKPKRKGNRGALPRHLPREEVTVEPETTTCSCGACMQRIGEDRSERLDIIPAQFKIIVTIRPKYACRACQEGVVQAPAPERLIAGGIPTEGLIAHVLINKYADHLPLYRQAQIFSRQGITLDRSTLADWVGRAARELRPVFDCLVVHLKKSTKLFMDETPVPVLDPGRGKTKTGYFWALARDERPWDGKDPPAVAYFYAPGRGGKYAEEFLEGFAGKLQVDGYAAYNRVTSKHRPGGIIILIYCWAHARRKLYEIAESDASPIAEEGLRQIAALYAIEKTIRGLSAEKRQAIRRKRSAPLIEVFEKWLEIQRARVSAKSRLGEALRYIAKHMTGLKRYLDDGRLEIDSNVVERTIRGVALNRKNALFAGHDEGAENWGMIASLIETCKLNGIEPHAWLTDTLERLVDGHMQSQIDELLPWNYKETKIKAAA